MVKNDSKRNLLLLILMLIPYIKPPYFNQIYIIKNLYNIFEIIVLFIIVLMFFKKKEYSKIYIYFVIFLAISFAITLFKGESIVYCAQLYIPTFAISTLVEFNIRTNPRKIITALLLILVPYAIINFITILFFPNGLYFNLTRNNSKYLCWFLGYKNPQIRILLPMVVLLFIYSSLSNKKTSKFTIIIFILTWLTILRLESSTALIGMTLFTVALFIKNIKFFKVIIKKINFVFLLTMSIIVIILIVKFNIQNYFAFFIENVLHRNLDFTDRVFIWKSAFNYIFKSPLIGYGIRNDDIVYNFINATHPHNYILYNLYNVGIIGTFVLLKIWNLCYKSLNKNINRKEATYLYICLLSFIIMGFTESLTDCDLLFPLLIIGYNLDYIKKEVYKG